MFGAVGMVAAGCAAAWWANGAWASLPDDDDRPRAEERRPDRPPRPREEDAREEGVRDDDERGERQEHDERRDRPRDAGDRPPREGGPRRGGPGDDRPPPPPPRPTKFARVLDSDRDGVISESELKDAVAALQKLDENGDGQLTAEEFELPPPPRPPRDADFRRRGDRGRPPMYDREGGPDRGPRGFGPPPPRDSDQRGPRPPRDDHDDRRERRPADQDD